jgi:membrane protease YdiL (CAAX protease family)
MTEALAAPPLSPREAFLAAARQGKNAWWRYLLAAAIVLAWTGLLALVIFLFVRYSGIEVRMPPAPTTVILGAIAFEALLIPPTILVMRVLHRRPALTLVTPTGRFSWFRFFLGTAVWGALLIATVAIDFALTDSWRAAEVPDGFLWYVLAVALLVPLQAGWEELVFRGYITQGVGLAARSVWVGAVVASLLFGVAHYNILMGPMGALFYAAFGLGFAIVALLDGRTELAIGAHAANNFVAIVVIRSSLSPIETPALWVQTAKETLGPGAVVQQALLFAVFIAITRFVLKRRGARD